MNKITFYIFILFFNLFVSQSFAAFTILVDPGHGGEDVGAKTYISKRVNRKWIKKIIYEKDLTLSLSKRIYKRLKAMNYNVFLSRSIDRDVSLQERADMADKINADLFVSIHFNSSIRKASHGVETYYLDNHSDVAVKKVETLENAGLSGEDLIINKILIDLVIERTAKSSKFLANKIHRRIIKDLGVKYKLTDRGVKPGLFYVLALSKRPGVLLEAGFLSNPKEVKKMLNAKFQDGFARSVVMGIDQYMKYQLKKKAPLLF